MTPLRQRMLDAMAPRRLVARTVEAYIHATVGLSRYFKRRPDRPTAEEVMPAQRVDFTFPMQRPPRRFSPTRFI